MTRRSSILASAMGCLLVGAILTGSTWLIASAVVIVLVSVLVQPNFERRPW